ncbi:tumor-associated calcium signal transducer 2 [Pelobates cultripes]|uniref:Tumor-associated calcium signal transducer 2 n=1 Tax=Pelobates cultripes TaxID=61616 RepID=A0AAD1VWS7_PELCU|nr:tumor-associated calcium signal transducer 2 [Pelobates cultripes]
MTISPLFRLGAALLCCILISQALGQDCSCNFHVKGDCQANGNACVCKLPIGPDLTPIDCTKPIPKCFLMKRESNPGKGGRRPKPENALVDNDGLYNPDCEGNGIFKARQCNNTETCWCVNSAGVRRTDKGDKNWKCTELVRTFWVIVQLTRNNTDSIPEADLKKAIADTITNRYKLPAKFITNIEFEGPLIYIDLKQNTTEKTPNDVDIADVGYYMEKDVKGDPIIPLDNPFQILVNGKNVPVKEPLIYYIDEKPHEISMKRLTAGVIAVIVVVVVAIVAGIVVLVLTRRKKGRYEKAEVKEMNEMQKQLTS